MASNQFPKDIDHLEVEICKIKPASQATVQVLGLTEICMSGFCN